MSHLTLRLLSTVILSLVVAPFVFAQQGPKPDLVLNGTVRHIKQTAKDDADFIEFVVNLDIKFSNAGKQPIIFFKPQPKPQAEIFRLQIESLALSRLQAETYPYLRDIWVRGMFTSINTSAEYSEMAARLDKAEPPTDLMIVLNPGGSWTWTTDCQLLFYKKTPITTLGRSPSGMDLGWDVISRIETPLWLRLRFQLWSDNLQRADKKLKQRLRKRWSKIGSLIVETEVDTQAIEISASDFKYAQD